VLRRDSRKCGVYALFAVSSEIIWRMIVRPIRPSFADLNETACLWISRSKHSRTSAALLRYSDVTLREQDPSILAALSSAPDERFRHPITCKKSFLEAMCRRAR
jgi:hypothetical protein